MYNFLVACLFVAVTEIMLVEPLIQEIRHGKAAPTQFFWCAAYFLVAALTYHVLFFGFPYPNTALLYYLGTAAAVVTAYTATQSHGGFNPFLIWQGEQVFDRKTFAWFIAQLMVLTMASFALWILGAEFLRLKS